MRRLICSTVGCHRLATWHARVTCDGTPRADEIALCRRCRNGVDRDDHRWVCMAHDDRVRLAGVHPIGTPECTHPDADWHDDGCVLPDAGLTVHDITHAGAAA